MNAVNAFTEILSTNETLMGSEKSGINKTTDRPSFITMANKFWRESNAARQQEPRLCHILMFYSFFSHAFAFDSLSCDVQYCYFRNQEHRRIYVVFRCFEAQKKTPFPCI